MLNVDNIYHPVNLKKFKFKKTLKKATILIKNTC